MQKYEVPLLTEKEKDRLKELTALALPDAPSARGYTAAQIKAALARAFVGEDNGNVASLIDRVVEDFNKILTDIGNGVDFLENEAVEATIEMLEPDQEPQVAVSRSEEGGQRKMRIQFSVPRGETGPAGAEGPRGADGRVAKFSVIDGVLCAQYDENSPWEQIVSLRQYVEEEVKEYATLGVPYDGKVEVV